MFADIVNSLTANDRRQLAALGVPSSRISEWKSLNRFPTRPQAAAISVVKGIPFDELERELAVLEAERDAEKNPAFASVAKTLKSKIRML